MRIIAGEFRGRSIKAVKGDHTRPTTDKIKENMFNMLGQFFDGGCALDLYAGSGNLGIEAISRGIDEAIFIDKHPDAIRTIHDNVKALRIEEKVQIYRNDAFKALAVLAKKDIQFDLIFLDPPYKNQKINEVLAIIAENGLLVDDGLVVCEYLVEDSTDMNFDEFGVTRQENYGITEIAILKNRKK